MGEPDQGGCRQAAWIRDETTVCRSHWAENPAVPAIVGRHRRLIGSYSRNQSKNRRAKRPLDLASPI